MVTVQGNCMWVRFNIDVARDSASGCCWERVRPTLHPPPTHHTHMYCYPFPVHLPLTTHFQTQGATGGIQPAAKGTPCVCSEGVSPWCQHSEGRAGVAGHLPSSFLPAVLWQLMKTVTLIAISHFITWTSHEPHMNVTWLSHECHMSLTWASHECHMTVTWMSHEPHMNVTWLSHDVTVWYKCLLCIITWPRYRTHTLVIIISAE